MGLEILFLQLIEIFKGRRFFLCALFNLPLVEFNVSLKFLEFLLLRVKFWLLLTKGRQQRKKA